MNKSYAKLINGHLQYAPSVLDTPGGIIMNPKRLSYLQAGWKFLDLQPPADPAPEGKEYAISGYTETATDIRPVFKLIALNSPRHFPLTPAFAGGCRYPIGRDARQAEGMPKRASTSPHPKPPRSSPNLLRPVNLQISHLSLSTQK